MKERKGLKKLFFLFVSIIFIGFFVGYSYSMVTSAYSKNNSISAASQSDNVKMVPSTVKNSVNKTIPPDNETESGENSVN